MTIHSIFNQSAQLAPGVGAWMSTRSGGCSAAPWDTFNLGEHVGDAPQSVWRNRQLLADKLQARPVFMRQVHGSAVLELTQSTVDGAVADACFTFADGLACTIMVADCLPALLWDKHGRWVAAAHAGWRGLAGQEGVGVLETLWAALTERGALANQTRVWLGPCIGPEAFEVGPEVLQAFGAHRPEIGSAFRPSQGDRWLADLPALARWRLRQMGLIDPMGNDGSKDWCTVSRPEQFFSHRRDAATLGTTGRMAACIWRK